MLNAGALTAAYIAATILFILALGGLSHQETARRGNWYGITGMAIALLATIFGVVSQNYGLLIGAMLIGAVVGLALAETAALLRGLGYPL